MTHDGVDAAALVADDALIARVHAANVSGQLGTELERLLGAWRIACRIIANFPVTANQYSW
jgi:hypothetical protein